MISSRLRARWRALTAILGLDLIGDEPDLRGHAARPAAASAAVRQARRRAPRRSRNRRRATLMAVRVLSRCEHCDALPDPETQRTLEGQLRDRRLGEYLDTQPGGWLIWTAGGALGFKRYACPQHRTDLTDYVRAHYGASRAAVSQTEPYPSLWPDRFSAFDEGELAELLGLAQPAASARLAATTSTYTTR